MFHNNLQIHYLYLMNNLLVDFHFDNNKLLFLLLKDNMDLIMLNHKLNKLDFHLLILNHMLNNLRNNYNICHSLGNNDLVLIHFCNMMLISRLRGNKIELRYILNFHIQFLMVLHIGDMHCYIF